MRRSVRLIASVFIASLLAPWAPGEAFAASEGKTAQGEAYVSGGVAFGEQDALDKRRADFSLRMVTAAKKNGSYLADAQVKITDAAGKLVFATPERKSV